MTHSLIGVAAVISALLYWHPLGLVGHYIWPLAIGYLSHVLGDMATPSGCPLLWPARRTFSARLWRTGAPVENVLSIGVAAAMIWLDGAAARQSAEDSLWQALAWSPWAARGVARLAGILAAAS